MSGLWGGGPNEYQLLLFPRLPPRCFDQGASNSGDEKQLSLNWRCLKSL